MPWRPKRDVDYLTAPCRACCAAGEIKFRGEAEMFRDELQ